MRGAASISARGLAPSRHPDESQDPGLRAVGVGALDPDFRQDDGGFAGRVAGFGFAASRLGCFVRGGCPMLVVILTEVRIQGYGRWGVGALDPDFRQDDGGFCWSGCGAWIRSGPAWLLGSRRPPHAGRHPDGGQNPGLRAGRLRLWVLTFVRMTAGGWISGRSVPRRRGRSVRPLRSRPSSARGSIRRWCAA